MKPLMIAVGILFTAILLLLAGNLPSFFGAQETQIIYIAIAICAASIVIAGFSRD